MTTQFDFQEAVKALQAGKKLNGKDGVLTSLIKQLSEAALQAELDSTLPTNNNLTAEMALALKQLDLLLVILSLIPREIEAVALNLNSLRKTKPHSPMK